MSNCFIPTGYLFVFIMLLSFSKSYYSCRHRNHQRVLLIYQKTTENKPTIIRCRLDLHPNQSHRWFPTWFSRASTVPWTSEPHHHQMCAKWKQSIQIGSLGPHSVVRWSSSVFSWCVYLNSGFHFVWLTSSEALFFFFFPFLFIILLP